MDKLKVDGWIKRQKEEYKYRCKDKKIDGQLKNQMVR